MSTIRLDVGKFGEEVTRLHESLKRHSLQVSPEEEKRKFFGPSTGDAVREYQKEHGLKCTGVVDETTADALGGVASRSPAPVVARSRAQSSSTNLPARANLSPLVSQPITGSSPRPEVDAAAQTNQHRVAGMLRHPGGQPGVGNLIFAFDAEFIGGAMLGQTTTNNDGFYSIRYDPKFYTRLGPGVDHTKETIDLVVQAYDAAGATIAESEHLHDPPREVRVDLLAGAPAETEDVVSAPPSEYPLPPVRPAPGELAMAKLLPILKTSRALAGDSALGRFARLFAEKGDFAPDGWIHTASEAGLSASQVDEAKLAMELGALTQHNLPAITELQSLRQSGRIRDGRDLVDLSTNEWHTLMRRTFPVGNEPANLDASIAAIEARLRKAYPTAYVEKAIATPPSLDLALIRRVIAVNPDFNPAMQAPKTLKLDGINTAERTAAEASLASLRREIRAYPDFDYRATLQSPAEGVNQHVNPIRLGVSRFLSQARDFDLHASRIDKYVVDHPESLEGVDRPTLVIAQIKRMQRVYRVAPDVNAMNALLGEGIHSAFRIARMPADVFVARFRDTLGGDDVAAKAYAAARSVTATTAAITWAARLRSAGPLPAAVGTWPPPDLQIGDAELQRLLRPGGGRSV